MEDDTLDFAVDQAKQGLEEGGIPIGAVLVHAKSNVIVGRGRNQRVQKGSAILHGEMDCLANAGRIPAAFLRECTLYTTLSPCPMCAGAILLFGIPRVVVGENVNFMGAEDHLRSQGVTVVVKQNPECIQMMREFIEKNKEVWNEDIGVP